jgi:hypothetical protein
MSKFNNQMYAHHDIGKTITTTILPQPGVSVT